MSAKLYAAGDYIYIRLPERILRIRLPMGDILDAKPVTEHISMTILGDNFSQFCVYDNDTFMTSRMTIHHMWDSGSFIYNHHKKWVLCIYCANDTLYSCDFQYLYIAELNVVEEDTHTNENASVIVRDNVSDSIETEYHCLNPSVYGHEFTKPVYIFMPNSSGMYSRPNCTTLEELEAMLRSDLDRDSKTYLWSIYSYVRPSDGSGWGSKPTGKIVVKMPFNNIYVTWGSVHKLFGGGSTRWYAVPLFGGRRKRVGNVHGIFYGIGVTHGQIPGHIIYKLYSYDEVMSQPVLHVREESSDYPFWFVDASKKLVELIPDSLQASLNHLILQLVE